MPNKIIRKEMPITSLIKIKASLSKFDGKN